MSSEERESKDSFSPFNASRKKLTGKKRKRAKRFSEKEDLEIVETIQKENPNLSSNLDWERYIKKMNLKGRDREAIQRRFSKLKSNFKKKKLKNSKIEHFFSSLIDKENDEKPRKKMRVFNHAEAQTPNEWLSNVIDDNVDTRSGSSVSSDTSNSIQPPPQIPSQMTIMKVDSTPTPSSQTNVSTGDSSLHLPEREFQDHLIKLIKSKYKIKRDFSRKKLHEDKYLIGCYRGETFGTEFVPGTLYNHILSEERKISRVREELKAQKRKNRQIKDLAFGERFKHKMVELKEMENRLSHQRQSFLRQKLMFTNEYKRCREEDCSRFNNFPVFKGSRGRYVLVKLLGRGGFSQVWKGIDVESKCLRKVAVKIHTIDPQWAEEKKVIYVRHVLREYDITSKLTNEFFAQIYENFCVDKTNMIFVLEYCKGDNLEVYIKNNYGVATVVEKNNPESGLSKKGRKKRKKKKKKKKSNSSSALHKEGENDDHPENPQGGGGGGGRGGGGGGSEDGNSSACSSSFEQRNTTITNNNKKEEKKDDEEDDDEEEEEEEELTYSAPNVMTEGFVKTIVYQLMKALRVLKIQDVIHYDLKPSNILIDDNGTIKITDFGLSKSIRMATSNANRTTSSSSSSFLLYQKETVQIDQTSYGAGTYYYQPPECFQKGAKISNKVDIWSLGVIFYQCLYNGKLPFGGEMNQSDMFNTITRNERGVHGFFGKLDFPKIRKVGKKSVTIEISETSKNFIRECLNVDQKKRPNIDQLFEKYEKFFTSNNRR